MSMLCMHLLGPKKLFEYYYHLLLTFLELKLDLHEAIAMHFIIFPEQQQLA